MFFSTEVIGSNSIITPTGARFDAALAPEFKKIVTEIIKDGAETLTLDFKYVEFIDSSGLGAIISIYKILHESGDLKLLNVSENVKFVFRLTHLDKILNVNQLSNDNQKSSAA